MARATVLVMLAVVGCGEVLDVDGYDLTDVDAGASGPTGSIYVPACRSCIESTCAEQLGACEANAACASLLGCIEDCRDPGCVSRCAAPDYSPNRTWPIESPEACLASSCVPECPIGETYDCSDYTFAAVYGLDEEVPLRVKVFDLAGGISSGVGGVEVTPCLSSDFFSAECFGDLPTRTTDGDGWVEFTLPLRTTGLEGYFTATDPTLPGVTYRYFRDFPFNDYWELNQLTVDRSGLAREIYTLETGRTFDESVGAIFFEIYDCNTWPAHGIVLEAEPPVDWVFYPSFAGQTVGEGRKDELGETLTTAPFIAVVGKPGDYTFELTLGVGGERLRRVELPIEPAHFDVRVLYP